MVAQRRLTAQTGLTQQAQCRPVLVVSVAVVVVVVVQDPVADLAALMAGQAETVSPAARAWFG
jgi:preprotein translocase subunit SecG